jgi:hypothetical protein
LLRNPRRKDGDEEVTEGRNLCMEGEGEKGGMHQGRDG